MKSYVSFKGEENIIEKGNRIEKSQNIENVCYWAGADLCSSCEDNEVYNENFK